MLGKSTSCLEEPQGRVCTSRVETAAVIGHSIRHESFVHRVGHCSNDVYRFIDAAGCKVQTGQGHHGFASPRIHPRIRGHDRRFLDGVGSEKLCSKAQTPFENRMRWAWV